MAEGFNRGRRFYKAETPIDAVFGNNSWEQISAASALIEKNGWNAAQVHTNLGWQLGESKATPMDGVNYGLRILGFNHDDRADGKGKAGISLELGPVCYGTTTTDRKPMNATNTNVGGWSECVIRQTTLPGLLSKLPTDLQAFIKPVLKKTSAGNTSSNIVITTDLLYLESEIEVFGSISQSFAGEGSQYALYAGGSSKIKQQPLGTNYSWRCRSPYNINNTGFSAVTNIGSYGAIVASNNQPISFGLSI